MFAWRACFAHACRCGSFAFVMPPFFPGMAGGIDGRFTQGRIVVPGNQGLAVPAIFSRYAAPGPQHIDLVVAAAFRADAADETLPISEGDPMIFIVRRPYFLRTLFPLSDSRASTV
jgi:hypothetical protein